MQAIAEHEPKISRVKLFLSEDKMHLHDAVRTAVGGKRMASLQDIMSDIPFMEKARGRWFFIDQKNAPRSGGWYRIVDGKTLLPTNPIIANTLPWHEKLYVYSHISAALRDKIWPLILNIPENDAGMLVLDTGTLEHITNVALMEIDNELRAQEQQKELVNNLRVDEDQTITIKLPEGNEIKFRIPRGTTINFG